MHWPGFLILIGIVSLVAALEASFYRRNPIALALNARTKRRMTLQSDPIPAAAASPLMTHLALYGSPLPLQPEDNHFSPHGPAGSTQGQINGSLEAAILDTLIYADVFDYPLTSSEVHRYLTFRRASVRRVSQALDAMLESGAIIGAGNWFALANRHSTLETRRRRAEMADGLWRTAVRYGRLIAALPFVRMVAVTGSLAMGNTEQQGDIDFLLVTAPGRLWTCRALVVLLTRFASLLGTTLCPNYLVTTEALLVHEHSLYVAHEMTQMVPLSGPAMYDSIRSANAWTDDYLPNAQGAPLSHPQARDFPRWQRVVEGMLAVLPIERFEAWEMKRKTATLSRAQSSSPEAYFSADVCKGHANSHRQRTEALLPERLQR